MITLTLSQQTALRAVYRPAGDSGTPFQRGDANADGRLDLSDAITVLSFLFTGGIEPTCRRSADVNDDGEVNITGPIRLLGHLFLGDPPPGGNEPMEVVCG